MHMFLLWLGELEFHDLAAIWGAVLCREPPAFLRKSDLFIYPVQKSFLVIPIRQRTRNFLPFVNFTRLTYFACI